MTERDPDAHAQDSVLTATVARIDERTMHLAADFIELKKVIESSYVSHAEFRPVRSIVYGLVGTIMLSVIGTILSVALRR